MKQGKPLNSQWQVQFSLFSLNVLTNARLLALIDNYRKTLPYDQVNHNKHWNMSDALIQNNDEQQFFHIQ